jgi:hypothetical protein
MEALRGGPGLRRAGGAGTVLASALALAGCGGASHRIGNLTATATPSAPGQSTFSAPGMAIHFRFPSSFRSVSLARSKRIAGNTGQASHAAVGIGPFDLLIVTRFPNRPIPVTRQNLNRLRPQFDAAVSSALGRKLSSVTQTVGGLPALSYPAAPVVGLPVPATSRITDVFVGDDQYELNCQYTTGGAAKITAACTEMLGTLTKAS